jgi:hypothetical protein
MYLYSPSVALEVPLPDYVVNDDPAAGLFPVSKGRDISAMLATLLLLSGIVPFRFYSFQSFLFQRQQC